MLARGLEPTENDGVGFRSSFRARAEKTLAPSDAASRIRAPSAAKGATSGAARCGAAAFGRRTDVAPEPWCTSLPEASSQAATRA